jgi:prophage antirepressor-like protein
MNLKTTGKFNHPIFGELCVYSDENHNCWFKASEVAEKLGYKNINAAISAHCKGVAKHDTLTKGGIQSINIIPEPDLYRLIFGSKLESAIKFQDWVFEDVLTSIRKTGMYVRQDILDRVKHDLPWGIQLLNDMKSDLSASATQRKIAQVKETPTGFTGVNHLFGWK